MYADDAAIFINPSKDDLETLKEILQIFGASSGLHINLQKKAPFTRFDVMKLTWSKCFPLSPGSEAPSPVDT
jgi:hypothetical protein